MSAPTLARTVPGATNPTPALPTASVNDVVTRFTPSHRPGPARPGLATVSVSVPLDHADLVAALFYWLDGTDGDPDIVADLDRADMVRLYVVETAVNVGLGRLEELRAETTGLTPADGYRWELRELARDRVTAVFGPAVTA
ncbi:hypothetical protein GCM10022243_63580 [Saccharothrix violaceirubra]|uniref:hypothetical protein n=1 Tax=Saccharothrix violaceirubra TaxID=413306 RepID=UPI0031E7FF8C